MPGIRTSRSEFAKAVGWLVAGWVLYVIARPPQIPFIPDAISLHALLPQTLRELSGPLPSLAHVVAMILLSASLLPQRPTNTAAVCALWAITGVVLELLQHPSADTLLARHLNTEFIQPLMRGSFDLLDIAGVACGTLLAWRLLSVEHNVRKHS